MPNRFGSSSSTSVLPTIDGRRLISVSNRSPPIGVSAITLEFLLPKPSYTIDTLRYLTENHGAEMEFSILMGADQLENPPMGLVVGARDHQRRTELPKQRRAQNRRLLRLIADRADRHITLLRMDPGKLRGIGRIHRDRLRHKRGRFIDQLLGAVDRKHFSTLFRKGPRQRHAELAETDDDDLLSHS